MEPPGVPRVTNTTSVRIKFRVPVVPFRMIVRVQEYERWRSALADHQLRFDAIAQAKNVTITTPIHNVSNRRPMPLRKREMCLKNRLRSTCRRSATRYRRLVVANQCSDLYRCAARIEDDYQLAVFVK